MKDLRMLIWLTQLGLSIAVPLGGFIFLGIWLHNSLGWGVWTIFAGLALGIISAVRGFLDSLKLMGQMSRDSKKEKPCISYNQHD